jgi:hypothetical protein
MVLFPLKLCCHALEAARFFATVESLNPRSGYRREMVIVAFPHCLFWAVRSSIQVFGRNCDCDGWCWLCYDVMIKSELVLQNAPLFSPCHLRQALKVRCATDHRCFLYSGNSDPSKISPMKPRIFHEQY